MLSLIRKAGIFFIILIFLFLILNLVHLAWIYSNPEGIWSFMKFIDLLRIVAGLILLLVIISIFGYMFYNYVISLIKRDPERPSFLKILGVFAVMFFSILLDYVFVMGFTLTFSHNMADINSYITQSGKLMNEGKYEQALTEAENAWLKEKDLGNNISPFFLFSRLYMNTEPVRKQQQLKKYSTQLNYAYCLQKNLQKLDVAEAMYKEIIEKGEEGILEPEHIQLSCIFLAELNLAKGKYSEAEKYYKYSISRLEFDKESQSVENLISSYILYATFLHQSGDKTRYFELIFKILDLYENSDLSRTSVTYLEILLTGASAHMQLRNLNDAASLLIKAQDLAEKRSKKEVYLHYLIFLGQYNLLASSQNESFPVIGEGFFTKFINTYIFNETNKARHFTLAYNCFNEVLEKSSSWYGKDTYSYGEKVALVAPGLLALGKIQEVNGLYADLLHLFEKEKENNREVYNNVLLGYTATASDLSSPKVTEAIEQIENHYFKKLSARYFFMTAGEKENYIVNTQQYINRVNSVYITRKDSKSVEKLYNNVLSFKNMALFSNKSNRDFLEKDSSTLYNIYQKWKKKKQQFEMEGMTSDINRIAVEKDLMMEEKGILEKLEKITDFVPYDPRQVKWSDIKSALKENEIAVEIVNIPLRAYSPDSIRYFALVLGSNYSHPHMIPLFDESDLIDLVDKKGGFIRRIEDLYGKDKARLYDYIWKPLEKQIAGKNKIYLSVSGMLHTISFPALLSDFHAEIIQLSSTRQILNTSPSMREKNSAALFGDIDYGKNENPSDLENPIERSVRQIQFSPLQYSGKEVTDIKAIIEEKQNNKADIFRGNLASKSLLKSLAGSNYNIMHLATHGFYINEVDRKGSQLLPSANASGNLSSPLLRTGLLLSGGNAESFTSHDDGILMGQEISMLNLSNFDLVVLSACDTGLGDIKGYEGVFGLQRAFMQAGVQNMIVSLWKVSDEHTAELMRYFYEQLISGLSVNESLKKAQLQMKDKYESPYYWAGFVSVR
jgi:CHAT domain-containing protein